MKKLLLLIATLSFSTFLFAQDIDKEGNDKVKSAVNDFVESNKALVGSDIAPDTANWTFPGSVGFNVSQTSYSATSVDGIGHSVAGDVFIKLNANYLRARHSWKNALDLGYGVNMYSEYDNYPKWHKTIDEIEFSTKYGYKFSKHTLISARMAFKSQFTRTYDYDAIDKYYENDENYAFSFSNKNFNDTTVVKSKWGNPATVNASLGIDYVPNSCFSIFISPATGRFTWCKEDFIAQNYSMPVRDTSDSKYKNGDFYNDYRWEIGAILRMEFSKKFNKVVTLSASSETFVAYNPAVQRYIPNGEYIQFNKDLTGEKVIVTNTKYNNNDFENAESMATFMKKLNNEGKLGNPKNGVYEIFKLNAIFDVNKFLKITFNSQFKFDSSELSYRKKVTKMDKKDIEYRDFTGEDIAKMNYGFRSHYPQFWESTSIGVVYAF